MKNQKGFMTVLVIIIMSIIFLILLKLIGLKQSDNEMNLVYYDGIQARYLAESGAKKAYYKIVYDENFRKNIKEYNKPICFSSTSDEFNNGSFQVNIISKNDEIKIYAKGKCHMTERQVILNLGFFDNNYKIISWKDC